MTDSTSADLTAHYAARVAAFRPLGDQLLIELEHEHSTPSMPIARGETELAVTPSGLFIPASVPADVMKTRLARVVAVGPGRHVEGGHGRVPMSCQAGDRIIIDQICLSGPFPEVAPGFHVTHDCQVLAVIEEE